MKWLDEIKEKESDRPYDCRFERVIFEDGFDAATKAISEKMQEILDDSPHDENCKVNIRMNSLYDVCDCWKAKLKELGIV